MNEELGLRILQKECADELTRFTNNMMDIAKNNGIRPEDFKNFIGSMCSALMNMADEQHKETQEMTPMGKEMLANLHEGNGRLH